ncbi:MAG TPA: DNA mismatch repair protein MutS [Candidatus Acidoferrum sp.]|nr:DNA mismatch repair protein MutS [Candidatus Acidoferrum sp.]
MDKLTPMMQQYMEIKERNADYILLYRLGDFYEMFFEDAKLASTELDLVLTGRDCGMDERAPMCGVPYHSVDAYIARLVQKGYKVAVCEQTEDPALAKGLVRREIVRLVTPGTVTDDGMLEGSKNNYLAAVLPDEAGFAMAFADASTGELSAMHLSEAGRVEDELARLSPREVLTAAAFPPPQGLADFCRRQLGAILTPLGGDKEALAAAAFGRYGKNELLDKGMDEAVCACVGLIVGYLEETQRTGELRLGEVRFIRQGKTTGLDLVTRRNLELTGTIVSGEKRGSLLGVLDHTRTAPGARLLRARIEQPLCDIAAITRRLAAVGELKDNERLREKLRQILSEVCDLQRLLTKVVYKTGTARELVAISATLRRVPELRELLAPCKSVLIAEQAAALDAAPELTARVGAAIVDDPPLTVREGGMIRRGYHPEADRLKDLVDGGRGRLVAIEAGERERTEIKNLKVSYNKVFGYYIEVSKGNVSKVPPDYIRKQTLVNCERYITPELKELEGEVLSAGDRLKALEYELFSEVRDMAATCAARIVGTAEALAELDCTAALAEAAQRHRYCEPEVDMGDLIEIKEGRHPVVERLLTDALFVPNDTHLDCKGGRMAIITGPNMAGKSTYMRQTALIVLMAQMGSFVPAQYARIGLVDRIFTRVGAADNIAGGQSTFMMEMSETAHILKNATKRSLIIFDEIGRGTSTFDGMSIARAVVEYVADSKLLGARTLFATHYHELTALEGEVDGLVNYNIAVKKRGDDITFLRKIVRGAADDSYGIEVAKLAGVPEPVIRCAKRVLSELESEKQRAVPRAAPEDEPDAQLSFSAGPAGALCTELAAIDVSTLTPLEALNRLYELQQRANKL